MKAIVAVILVIALAVGAWFLVFDKDTEEAATPSQTAMLEQQQATEDEEPEKRYPIDGVEVPEDQLLESDEDVLPEVNDSDPTISQWLDSALGTETWTRLLVTDDQVRRFVATVDNLDKKRLPEQVSVLKSAPGELPLDGAADTDEGEEADSSEEGAEVETMQLTEANIDRYQMWLGALEQLNDDQLVAAYVSYYPLLEEAYNDLGDPGAYFNDRLIEVVDDMLEAPSVEFPIEVVPMENNRYAFADESLEELSAGQKALIRMGPENARMVKSRLRDLRQRLAIAPPEPVSQREAVMTPEGESVEVDDVQPSAAELKSGGNIGDIEVDLDQPLKKMSKEEAEARFGPADDEATDEEDSESDEENGEEDGDEESADEDDEGDEEEG